MITIHAWGETALMWLKAAPKGIKNVKRALEKEKQPGGKEGKNNIIDSSKLLEVQMWEYCNREGIRFAEIVQYFGIVFRKRLRNLGKKEERRKAEVQPKDQHHQENESLSAQIHHRRYEKGFGDGSGPWTCLEWQFLGSATVAGAGLEEAVGECCWQQAGW